MMGILTCSVNGSQSLTALAIQTRATLSMGNAAQSQSDREMAMSNPSAAGDRALGEVASAMISAQFIVIEELAAMGAINKGNLVERLESVTNGLCELERAKGIDQPQLHTELLKGLANMLRLDEPSPAAWQPVLIPGGKPDP